MEVKIARLKPTEKNYDKTIKIMDFAQKEILKGILIHDWHLFKDLKGFEIMKDKRFELFIKKRKYGVQQFRNILSPLRKKDFMDENVNFHVAQGKEKELLGFTIYAMNNELEEFDILLEAYIFEKYRGEGIGKKILGEPKLKVILEDYSRNEIRTLLKRYYQEKTIYGVRKEYIWTPLNEKEERKLQELTGKELKSITTKFEKFMDRKEMGLEWGVEISMENNSSEGKNNIG